MDHAWDDFVSFYRRRATVDTHVRDALFTVVRQLRDRARCGDHRETVWITSATWERMGDIRNTLRAWYQAEAQFCTYRENAYSRGWTPDMARRVLTKVSGLPRPRYDADLSEREQKVQEIASERLRALGFERSVTDSLKGCLPYRLGNEPVGCVVAQTTCALVREASSLMLYESARFPSTGVPLNELTARRILELVEWTLLERTPILGYSPQGGFLLLARDLEAEPCAETRERKRQREATENDF